MEKLRSTRHLFRRTLTPLSYFRSRESLIGRQSNLFPEAPARLPSVFSNLFNLRCFAASKTWSFQHRFYPIGACRRFGSLTARVERNPSFTTVNSEDICYFNGILGEKNVVRDEDRVEDANTDWMRKYRGSSKLLLQPKTTDQVSKILSYCNSRKLAVVPQGGNTGLVGGSVPVFDEVIVNMRFMNNIISFDKVSGILVCEAGCILENLESFLEKEGITLGSEI